MGTSCSFYQPFGHYSVAEEDQRLPEIMERSQCCKALSEAKGLIRQHNFGSADACIAKLKIAESVKAAGEESSFFIPQRGGYCSDTQYHLISPSKMFQPIRLLIRLDLDGIPMVQEDSEQIPLAVFLKESHRLTDLSNKTVQLWKTLAKAKLSNFPTNLRDSAVKKWRALNSFPKWMKLPAEIREQIARWAIFAPATSFDLNLTLVNKDMHGLTSYMMYARRMMCFDSRQRYDQFTFKLTRVGFNNLRCIEILCHNSTNFNLLSACYADVYHGRLSDLRRLYVDIRDLGKHPAFGSADSLSQQLRSFTIYFGPFYALASFWFPLWESDVVK